nr:hypothetical protein 16 [bacterium]
MDRICNVKLEDGVLKFSEVFRIKDGASTSRWSDKVGTWIKAQEDGEFEIIIQPLEITKTQEQLAYIHVLLKYYEDEVGCTPVEAKIGCKELAGFYEVTYNPIKKVAEKNWKSFGKASLKELSRVIDVWYTYLTVDAGMDIPTAEEYKELRKKRSNNGR